MNKDVLMTGMKAGVLDIVSIAEMSYTVSGLLLETKFLSSKE